jgi:hypothetical protein
MKKIGIIFCGLLLFQFSIAQDTTKYSNKKNEINIGYFNLFELNSINNFGIGYKCVMGNGAFRIGTSFYYNYSDRSDNSYNNYQSTQKSITIFPRIGYEFRQNYNRIIVYYGFDLCGSIGEYMNKNYYSGTYNSKEVITNSGIGLSPFIGVKFFINKRISISTETSFNFMYSCEKSKSSTIYDTHVNETDTRSIIAKLSPLGIVSINFHF